MAVHPYVVEMNRFHVVRMKQSHTPGDIGAPVTTLESILGISEPEHEPVDDLSVMLLLESSLLRVRRKAIAG